MRGEPSEFSIFVARLARAAKGQMSDYTVAERARELSALSRKMNAIATRQCGGYRPDCNGHKDDSQEERDLRAWARAESVARQLARGFGFDVHTQGDPRGYCLKLLLPGESPGATGGYGVPF